MSRYEVRVFSSRAEDGWRTLVHNYAPIWIEEHPTLESAKEVAASLGDGYYGLIFNSEGRRVR